MDFDWNQSESALKERVAGLFDDALREDLEAAEASEVSDLRGLTLNVLGRLAEVGYLSSAIGPAARLEMTTLVAAQEELAGISGSLLLAAESSVRLFGGLIAGFGSEGQQAEILAHVMKGKAIGAVALSEPGGDEPQSGWNTTAVKDGERFRVSGQKCFVTNGPLADWIAVAGTVDGKPTFFIVKPEQPGVRLGERIKTMGYNGMAVCPVELEDVVVEKSRVIGPFDDDAALVHLHAVHDLALASASLGVSKRSMNSANDYARSYHRGAKPVYAHQEVRFRISDMFTLYQTSQLLTYRAAWFYATGEGEAGTLIGCAKVFTAEAAEQIASMALQIVAGQGYVSGNPVERGYREAKLAALAGTTSEVSRMNIADELLRRYAI